MPQADGRICKDTLVIRPTIGKRLVHLPQYIFAYFFDMKVKYSADTAHLLSQSCDWQQSSILKGFMLSVVECES